jgi:alcohol dehydrogenase (NADP+)
MIQHVTANFFSRMIKFADERKKGDPDGTSPPSGALATKGSEFQAGSVISFDDGIILAHLSNNNKIPLVGVGVGNSPYKFVRRIVEEAVHDTKKSYLIDTSHARSNEKLVAQGILDGFSFHKIPDGEKIDIHVVTKVWFTFLGFERTQIAVTEMINNFKEVLNHESIDLKIHVLLNYPRCSDTVSWMDCDKEEETVPARVKAAGPDPRLQPDQAWKDSWRLLENMYLADEYPIASIGVSNFHLHDIEQMGTFARIHPQILQVNIWTLLYDAPLINFCHKHRIHVQVHNTFQSTLAQSNIAPRANRHIQKVAHELSAKSNQIITPAQVVLAWLVQHGVSVIPRTSRMSHLTENSAVSIASVPGLDDMQVETVAHAVEAYLSVQDLDQDLHVSVSFHAVNKDLMIYWKGRDGDQDGYVALVRRGEIFNETTYPNHIFRTYDASNKDIYVDHQVQANFGDHESIKVEL